MAKNIIHLLAEIICEIFDNDPNAELKLGLTNNWFYEQQLVILGVMKT
jgi:hypothetical protein